jgi:hypothetical protein
MDLEHLSNRGLEDTSNGVSRRTLTRAILGGGFVATVLALGTRTEATAQGTPETADAGPTRYQLKGGDVEIVFVPAVESGEVQFEYRDAAASITFGGDDVTSEISPALGRFVSVVIEQVDDGYTKYLTLLVPEVNPDENGHEVPITTVAVMTRHMTSIGGPRLVQGALQRYDVVELEGVAQFSA